MKKYLIITISALLFATACNHKTHREFRSADNSIVATTDYIGDDSIARVTLMHIPEEYRGKTLAETRLRAETGILVMLVERSGGKNEAARADTVFEVGDKLTVFGDYRAICRTFHAREHFAD